MITVLARLRVDDWAHFKAVHDDPARLELRRANGNLTHHVLNQLDDFTDVVFLDTWSSPQDADDYYFSDAWEATLAEMRGTLIELIKLEETQAAAIEEGPGPV